MKQKSFPIRAKVCTTIQQQIFVVRGQNVMLDADLAVLYEVSTKVLVQAVKRNPKRFPGDFMFLLSKQEVMNLRSQFVTSRWGGRRYLLPPTRAIGFHL